MEEVIRVKDLTFSYKKRVILDKANFVLRKGEFFLLTGANGAGKSTFMKLLLGLLPMQEGSIEFWGQPADKFSQWSRIGYLSQKASVFNFSFPATVEEVLQAHILTERKKRFFKDKKDGERIKRVLNMVGLDGMEKRLMGRLSGGQQQRVFIARTLLLEPEVLLLDEPNASIDKESADILADILIDLNGEKQTSIILIAHNWSAFDDLPALELRDGQLIRSWSKI